MNTEEHSDSTVSKPLIWTDLTSKDPEHVRRRDWLLSVGATVFQHDSDLRVLLLQRASSEHSMPEKWEVPGGGVETDDASIVAAVNRELKEETGLKATEVRSLTSLTEYVRYTSDAKTVKVRKDGTLAQRDKRTFWIEVDGGDNEIPPTVTIKPDEHQAWEWVTEERVLETGDSIIDWTDEIQRQDVITAFEVAKGERSPLCSPDQ